MSDRRTLEHWHPGMEPEYPWPPTPVVGNGVQVLPYALVDRMWLAAHPEYTAALRTHHESRRPGGSTSPV
jgi:hypothetical protein